MEGLTDELTVERRDEGTVVRMRRRLAATRRGAEGDA
jgi:hypothetical protein